MGRGHDDICLYYNCSRVLWYNIYIYNGLVLLVWYSENDIMIYIITIMITMMIMIIYNDNNDNKDRNNHNDNNDDNDSNDNDN